MARVVKNLPENAGDMGSIPGSGRSAEGGHGNPLQSSCLENPMDRGAWWATVHRVTQSDTTEQLTMHRKWLKIRNRIGSFKKRTLVRGTMWSMKWWTILCDIGEKRELMRSQGRNGKNEVCMGKSTTVQYYSNQVTRGFEKKVTDNTDCSR